MIKRILFSFCLFFVFVFNVNATQNKIYSIDIDVYLDEYGTAEITEKWDVDGDDGSEWYKCLYNLGNSQISDFKVSMDEKALKHKSNWNVNESLKDKRGYYGINYTLDGPELCFGKYDYNRHTFTLKYKLNNMVFNTSDSQVLYFKFIDSLFDVDFEDFSINISSFYKFPLELDVWGYGNKGYAYVEDGVIKALNEGKMNDQYSVLLVKFPLGTFKTDNEYDFYPDFDSVYEEAEYGSYDHDYDYDSDYEYSDYDDNDSGSLFDTIMNILGFPIIVLYFLFPIVFVVSFILFIISSIRKSKLESLSKEYKGRYIYKNNLKINRGNTNYFRDIPCDNDIFLADAIIRINKFSDKEINIIGSLILKWIREGKITYDVVKKDGKTVKSLNLTKKVKFDTRIEKELFDVMYKASKDGILEIKEFEKWCKKNYYEFLKLFSELKNATIKKLIDDKHISKSKTRTKKAYYIMDDKIYEESKKLFGLKMFLEDFSRIHTREVIDVHLWDEYLMFAYLFGIADKVSKQLKRLYPEISEEIDYCNYFDVDLLNFIEEISTNGHYVANIERKSAIKSTDNFSSVFEAVLDYSMTGSGGGGFSSGGGGGGSFGGGGGGSR